MRRSSSTLMWCGKLRILRRRDLSLVGGRLRLTTPTEEGSPSDELLEREPQSVTNSVAFCLDDGEVFVDSLPAASSTSSSSPSSPSSSSSACSCSCSADWTSIMDGSAIRRRQLASAFTNSLLLLLPLLPPPRRVDESVLFVLVLLLLAMVLAIADGLARASGSSLFPSATVESNFDFNSPPPLPALGGSSSSPTGLVRTVLAARSSSPED